MIVVFETGPNKLLRDASELGRDFVELERQHKLKVVFTSPQVFESALRSPDSLLLEIAREINARRIFVDGIGLLRPVSPVGMPLPTNGPGSYRELLQQLLEGMQRENLLTTFFNYENPELLGISSYMPEFPVSSIVDNIILLSLVELGSSLHRCIAVVKARGCKHEFDTREFTIGKGGISLIPVNKRTTLPVLPIESYSSLLSRAPTRVSPRQAKMTLPAKFSKK